MDEKNEEIIAGFSGKQDRSRLAFHNKLIIELNRRGEFIQKNRAFVVKGFSIECSVNNNFTFCPAN